MEKVFLILHFISLLNEEKKFRKNIKQFMNGKILILCINEVLAHLKLR